MGYHRAFPDAEIIGVDINPQPRYPFTFVQADALDYLDEHGHEFDFIHASPPCQAFTAYRRRGVGVGSSYPNLIPSVRTKLVNLGAPWVIENVVGAPLDDPVMLCGSSFGLDVRRHRLFQCSAVVMAPPCVHGWQTPRFPSATNRSNLRRTVEVGVWRIPLEVQRAAMGIDWMELRELSESIPPAYTEHIGREFLRHLVVAA